MSIPRPEEIFSEEEQKLARLEKIVSAKVLAKLQETDKDLVQYHVSLGPDAHKHTVEELVQFSLDVDAQVRKEDAAWNALSEQEKLLSHLKDATEALGKISKIKATLDEIVSDRPNDYSIIKKLSEATGIASMVMFGMRETETFNPREVDYFA